MQRFVNTGMLGNDSNFGYMALVLVNPDIRTSLLNALMLIKWRIYASATEAIIVDFGTNWGIPALQIPLNDWNIVVI